jgi:cell division transport system permease protein
MIGRTLYFTQKALGSIRESPWVSLSTSATIAAALLVTSLYALALDNLGRLALVWGRSASLTAYVGDDVPEERWEGLRAELEERPGVERAVLVRPAEALERFRARGAEAAALVAGVDPKVLPASVALSLDPGHADLTSLEALAREVRAVGGVADVDYGKEELERLGALLRALRVAGLVGALLIALATAFIVSNTIRLTVYARRDEIGILGLVGATAWFVRAPFLIEGALWGAAGGGVAVLALFGLDRVVAPSLSRVLADVLGGLDIRLFEPRVALTALGAGILLGALASGLAVRRFLDLELR